MVHRIVVAAVVVAALAFAPAAGAAVTASSVTSPANGAGFDVDLDAPGQVVVTGTATADNPATDTVRIVCTYAEGAGGGASALAPATATGALTPTGPNTGTFSVQVSADAFDYFTCRLRAVPSGALPADYRPFTGPVAHFHGRYTIPPNQPPGLRGYYQDVSGPLGYWDGASVSSCLLFGTFTLDPATLGYGQLFGCATVSGSDPTGTRAALQVDGRDAFLPWEAFDSYGTITGGEPITGFTRQLDPASGDYRHAASEPIVRCADGSTTYPPTCPAWADAGMSDRATTVGSHGGRLVRHTDTWANSGSVARRLDVWYQISAANPAPQWQFPGETAYAAHAAGDHSGAGGTIPTPPAGPASVLVADDPAQASYLDPRGSITWSSAPSEIRFAASNRLYVRYVRTVPARGAVAISLAFATDGAQANVDALNADARAGMRPTVAITSPADGARVAAAAVTVTGTATDDGPVSVTVNGRGAPVTANRTWSVAVPLRPGANTLVATARDSDGNTARAQRTVTLATGGPAPPRPAVMRLRAPSLSVFGHLGSRARCGMRTGRIESCRVRLVAGQRVLARGRAASEGASRRSLGVTLTLTRFGRKLLAHRLGGVRARMRARAATSGGVRRAATRTRAILRTERFRTPARSWIPGEARLTARGRSFVRSLRGKLIAVAGVRCAGHDANVRGTSVTTSRLSLARAARMCEALSRLGVRPRPRLAGQGDSRPIASNATRSGRAENRRVEVTLTHRPRRP